jgi:hypothetical protein
VEVEGGADADEDGGVDAVAHGGHPLLLLGHADPDPDDVRVRGVDVADDALGLLRAQRTERGRVAADDPHAGIPPAQVERELDERALAAPAVEVHRVPVRAGALERASHELGPVDAVREVVAEGVHRPHERLAVGHGQVGGQDGGAQLGVLLAGHDGVGRGDAHVAAAPRRTVASIQSSVRS